MFAVGVYEYHERNFLGKGAFGSVYQGRNRNTGMNVAIKVVNYYINNQQRREIDNLKDMNCQNIVSLLDYYTFRGRVFIVMELCVEDLESRIKNIGRDISEPEIRNFLRQTSRGLQYIHDMGIVHRDIKPANILIKRVSRKIIYKIADFGISKMIEYSQIMTSIGTVFYMAPELKKNKTSSFNADIWSLGITVCYMLSRDMSDLDYTNFDISDQLEHLISMMLKVNRHKRYNAEDVLNHNFINNY